MLIHSIVMVAALTAADPGQLEPILTPVESISRPGVTAPQEQPILNQNSFIQQGIAIETEDVEHVTYDHENLGTGSMSYGGQQSGTSVVSNWFHPSCGMVQHSPYIPQWQGYYSFIAPHFANLSAQQQVVQHWGGDPDNVTDNRFLENIAQRYEQQLITAGQLAPPPVVAKKLSDLPLLQLVP